MPNFPKVAIIYLSYHPEPYLKEAMDAISALNYPKDKIELVIVDNPHPAFGSAAEFIKKTVLPRSGVDLPKVTFLPQDKNSGFCGGNNVGLVNAMQNDCEFAYLHNQDGLMEKDCLLKLVDALQSDPQIGCAQSLVLLHPETDKINTAGNSFHYLGFGFINNFGVDKNTVKAAEVKEIGYATGSSLMMRVDLLKKYGMLDEDLFAYHEDVEYSLRLKLAGFKVVCVTDSVFLHKYIFNRSSSKFYYMERNRYAVLLMYYKWLTLILLLPMLIIMEIGMIFFFAKHGWWKEKMDIYRYWLEGNNWKLWLKKRKAIQAFRKISDRELLALTVSTVKFGAKQFLSSPLLIYIANPLMFIYGWIVKTVVFW